MQKFFDLHCWDETQPPRLYRTIRENRAFSLFHVTQTQSTLIFSYLMEYHAVHVPRYAVNVVDFAGIYRPLICYWITSKMLVNCFNSFTLQQEF